MNKFTLTLSSVALLATTQIKAQTNLSIGPVGSIGASRVTNVMPDGADFRLSGALGVGLVYSANTHWGFGFQALASSEGFAVSQAVQSGEIKYHYNPLYLRMPLTVNYFFGKYGNSVRPKIYAGPSVGIKLSESTGYSLSDGLIDNFHITTTDRFKSFDFGVQAGAGANVRVGRKMWLNMDAGYYQGVLNVIKDNGNTNYRNQNIRFNVGLMFGI